ncbi:hypothetical protein LOK49_LG10G02645 [Camellia lanceoleosa]|uniref:Uncharacterized protein n=1 Tax=Camellia lanceoleosa TaxID=1840588 RepID=A0ACC0GEJ7_9ERIC|nr:hypothetical protein LOK49_LG10G02645 [Camellia lanceoleosa]
MALDGIKAMTPAAINATTVAVANIHQKSEFLEVNGEDIQRNTHKLESLHPDVGLFRVPGIFPTFSKDGSKLAFMDNEFKAVWVANSKGLRIVYQSKETLNICAIPDVSSGAQRRVQLTKGSNNAFPSTNPYGTKLVFRSTRDGGDEKHKNLYIMENAQSGEYGGGEITRLTNGPWTDTHWCCSFGAAVSRMGILTILSLWFSSAFVVIDLSQWSTFAFEKGNAGSGFLETACLLSLSFPPPSCYA